MVYLQPELGRVWVCLPRGIARGPFEGRYDHTFPQFEGEYEHTHPQSGGGYEHTHPQSGGGYEHTFPVDEISLKMGFYVEVYHSLLLYLLGQIFIPPHKNREGMTIPPRKNREGMEPSLISFVWGM